MSWSTLDWTGLYSLSGIYCIGLPGSRLRHIEWHPRGWRDMATHPHSQTPLGTRLGG